MAKKNKINDERLDVIYDSMIEIEKDLLKAIKKNCAYIGKEGFDELVSDFSEYIKKSDELYQKNKFTFKFSSLKKALPKNKWVNFMESKDYLFNTLQGVLSDREKFNKSLEKKLEVKEILEDTKIIRDNVDHIKSIIEMIPADYNAVLNVHINPHTGVLLDRAYEDNQGFIVKKKNKRYSIELECELTERGKKNIAHSIYMIRDKFQLDD